MQSFPIKFLISGLLLVMLALSACQGGLPASPDALLAEQNKTLVRRAFEEPWNQGNLAAVDEVYAETYVGHVAGGEPVMGSEGHKQLITIYRAAFPDLHFTLEDMTAAGDKVTTRWTLRGANTGELMGLPPTGAQIEVTGTDIHRIENGQVVEVWAEFNELTLLAQLGFELVPPAAVAEAANETLSVETVRQYAPETNALPEGVTVDRQGNIYVSINSLGEVRKISPEGDEVLLAHFEEASTVGLTIDAEENVYVAVSADNPDIRGVHRLSPTGASERLAGTEAMDFPNALTFDQQGNLYVTDSIQGAIWRIPAGGEAELWFQDTLLQGTEVLEFGFPIGANGIAWRQGEIFVANSEKAHIIHIPIRPDGTAGKPDVVVTDMEQLLALDGIALDIAGNIYALVITQSKLVQIDPETGAITTLATAENGLDWPASLAFGLSETDRESIFITNFAIGPEGGPGPGVVKVEVGVPGFSPTF